MMNYITKNNAACIYSIAAGKCRELMNEMINIFVLENSYGLTAWENALLDSIEYELRGYEIIREKAFAALPTVIDMIDGNW